MKKLICILLISSFVVQLHAQQLRVASYNIRYDNKGDAAEGNGWEQRLPYMAALIQFNDFELMGAQEVMHHQLNDLLASLPGYAYVGIGRDDGKTKGEYAPIFYKTERLGLITSGHFWLSEITDRPNKGWDAALPRICTWAKFEDKASGITFYHFNLHMDHIGVEARKQSAALVLEKAKEIAGDEPVLLTGDFNVDQESDSYQLITASGELRDAYEAAQVRYAPNGTFNAFEVNYRTQSRIDHIFVSRSVQVDRYGILTDTYHGEAMDSTSVQSGNFPKEYSFKKSQARLPSDHYPVMVVLEFK